MAGPPSLKKGGQQPNHKGSVANTIVGGRQGCMISLWMNEVSYEMSL